MAAFLSRNESDRFFKLNLELMITIFWCITIVLVLMACAFFIPWIRSWRLAAAIGALFVVLSYGLYSVRGSSKFLPEYYAKTNVAARISHQGLRSRLASFKKKEFQLRLQLQRDPGDLTAQWKLFDVLATQSIYQGEFSKATDYWKEAKVLLFKDRKRLEYAVDEERIKESINVLNQLKVGVRSKTP